MFAPGKMFMHNVILHSSLLGQVISYKDNGVLRLWFGPIHNTLFSLLLMNGPISYNVCSKNSFQFSVMKHCSFLGQNGKRHSPFRQPAAFLHSIKRVNFMIFCNYFELCSLLSFMICASLTHESP